MDPITWTDETRQLTALSPWARNPRKIENAQAKRLQESFKEFGQPEQIVIGPDNELYNGHQRLKSWLSKFGDIEIDVRVSSRPLTEKEREKLTIYLHKGAVGEFDFDILSAEFEFDDLLEWGFEADELGFDLPETSLERGGGGQLQKERAEELRGKWAVETGQLWHIGEHRLICGDCTDPSVAWRLMQGEKVDCVVSDPPYDINVSTIHSALELLSNRAVLLLGGKQAFSLCTGGWEYRLDLLWRHREPRTIPSFYLPVVYHNNILVVAKTGFKTSGWKRPRKDFSSVVEIEESEFPTEWTTHAKSTSLFVEMLSGFDYPLFADPFVGAGTSVIACEQLGRRCLGIEIDPATLAVAIERLNLMGLAPVLNKEVENGPHNLD